ncbi:MAG: hypothetical protein P8Y34_03880 [Anaerolineales bacterium]|jgi:hypothetical protein
MDLKRRKTLFLIAFLVLVVVWMVIFVGRIADYRRLSAEFDHAQHTLIALTATTGALSTQVVWAGSDQAVEQWAYVERKWIREGDQRVAIMPVEGTPAPELLIQTATPEPENRFKIWWELFFSTKP